MHNVSPEMTHVNDYFTQALTSHCEKKNYIISCTNLFQIISFQIQLSSASDTCFYKLGFTLLQIVESKSQSGLSGDYGGVLLDFH